MVPPYVSLPHRGWCAILWSCLLALFAGGFASCLEAQEAGTITGRAVVSGTDRGIEAVQIHIPELGLGTLSSSSGRYLLVNVPPGTYTVRAQRIGYQTQTQSVTVEPGQAVELNFSHSQSALELDQIVVTGAGAETERRKLGNTIASIDNTELATSPVQSFSEIIQGREAGVMGLPESGLTGEGSRIRIRGSASLSQSNEPIVYVDGIRVDNSGGFHNPFGSPGGGGSPSRLDDISPESIERVEILKGAAAATLYGTEASNGVIQIFTKRGQSGAPRWNFRTEISASKYPLDRAYEPTSGWVASDSAAQRLTSYLDRPVRPFEVFQVPELYEQAVETGIGTSNSLSVTGGSSDVTYFLSGRHSRENGPFGMEDLGPARDLNQSTSASGNVQIFPVSQLKVALSVNYTDRHMEVPQNNNNIFGPISLLHDANPNELTCGESQQIRIGRCDGPGNPLGSTFFATPRETMHITTTQDVEHFTGSLNSTYEVDIGPTMTLALNGTVGIDVTNQTSAEVIPFGWDVDNFTSFNTDGSRNVSNRKQEQITVDLKSGWEWEISDSWSSSLVVGGQGFFNDERIVGSFGRNYPGPGLKIVSAGADQGNFELGVEQINAGFFAQEQLGFRDFAFLTVGGRFDRHSAFGVEAPTSFYPKGSISVMPSHMTGWDNSLISTLRLRAAIGQSGLQPGVFDKFTTFSPLASEEGPGLVSDNLGNAELKPEISTEWEIGGEIGVLDDRASLNFTYWNRDVDDALVARQFAVSGGFINEQLVNLGKITAQGAEASLQFFAINKSDVSLEFFANGAYLKEEVVDLGGAPPLKVGGSYPRYRNFVKEGHSPGAYFGAKLLQVGPDRVPFDSDGDGQPDPREQYLSYLSDPRGLDDAGLQPLMADEDGDGDPRDHYLGKPIPDWQGAFGLSGTLFRNFQFSTLFEYKTGEYHTYNLTYAFRREGSWSRNTPLAAQVEATVNDPASTAEDRLEAAMTWATKIKALAPHSGMNAVEKADFIRWREMSVTYNVPERVRFGLRSLDLTLTGRNLMLWSGYSGVDPEANNNGRGGAPGSVSLSSLENNFLMGVDMYGLPLQRRFSFRVSMGF